MPRAHTLKGCTLTVAGFSSPTRKCTKQLSTKRGGDPPWLRKLGGQRGVRERMPPRGLERRLQLRPLDPSVVVCVELLEERQRRLGQQELREEKGGILELPKPQGPVSADVALDGRAIDCARALRRHQDGHSHATDENKSISWNVPRSKREGNLKRNRRMQGHAFQAGRMAAKNTNMCGVDNQHNMAMPLLPQCHNRSRSTTRCCAVEHRNSRRAAHGA